jgi:hypothetical protein
MDLIGTLQALDDGSDPSAEKEDKFNVAISSAFYTSQEILKTEWKRVKKRSLTADTSLLSDVTFLERISGNCPYSVRTEGKKKPRPR